MIRSIVAACILATACSSAPAQSVSDFTVITLGTGTPPPILNRFGPATLVRAGQEILLFDAGRGATQRLMQSGIKLGSITGLFVTHLHSDHIVGIPDLWLTGWLPSAYAERKNPLKVIGPAGTRAMMTGLEQAYAWDIQARIADQNLPKEGVAIDATDISEGVVYERNGVKVTAFEVDHGPLLKPAFGYRIDFDGRSVALSGDTKFSENLIKHVTGVDLLIHQSAMAKDEFVQAAPFVKAILDHHTKPEEAGVVFTRSKPRLAAFYHLVLLGTPKFPAPTEAEVVAKARTTYAGPLVVSEDLMHFAIAKDAVTVTPPKQ